MKNFSLRGLPNTRSHVTVSNRENHGDGKQSVIARNWQNRAGRRGGCDGKGWHKGVLVLKLPCILAVVVVKRSSTCAELIDLYNLTLPPKKGQIYCTVIILIQN